MRAGALSGYRILDLADESGAYGTKQLADLGAEVVKVEPPKGSRTRHLPPFAKTASGDGLSLYHAYMDTNKKSVTLNLNTAEGQGLFRRLAEWADAVYDTSPPGQMAELGIGHEQLSQTNPRLVWVSLTPFGLTGPRRDWKGSDLVAWASSGTLYSNGFPEQAPTAPAQLLLPGYALASLHAAAGCLFALEAREITGRGQLVDVSIQEAVIMVAGEAPMPAFLDDLIPRVRFGNRRPYMVPMGVFRCKDGYIQLVIGQPAHWSSLANWIKEKTSDETLVDPMFEDRHQRIQMKELVEGSVESLAMLYTKQEFYEGAQRRGISATPLNTAADLLKDPQLAARGYWAETNHPQLGRVRMAGAPYRLSESPWQAGRAPALGEHNETIYSGELGLSSTELASLKAKGAI